MVAYAVFIRDRLRDSETMQTVAPVSARGLNYSVPEAGQ